jgi:hypothetical protein
VEAAEIRELRARRGDVARARDGEQGAEGFGDEFVALLGVASIARVASRLMKKEGGDEEEEEGDRRLRVSRW